MRVPAKDPAEVATEQADLDRLAAEVAARGYGTQVVTRPGQQPCLVVQNPEAELMTERIYARDGFFIWSWHQPLAPRTEITTAADRITQVLRTSDPEAVGS